MVIEVDILAFILYAIGIFTIGLITGCAFGVFLDSIMVVHKKRWELIFYERILQSRIALAQGK